MMKMLKPNLISLFILSFLTIIRVSNGFLKLQTLHWYGVKDKPNSAIFGDLKGEDSLLNEIDKAEGRQLGIDEDTRLRLKVELDDPLRLLRNYAYFAMVGGGGLGTLVTLPQIIKLVVNQNYEDLKTASFNLAINLGGVVGGIWLFLREKRQEEKKLEKLRVVEKQNKNKLSTEEVERREAIIDLLPVELLLGMTTTVSITPSESITAEGTPIVRKTETTRTVSIKDLREKGQQSIVITAGDYSYIRKCLIDLRLRDQEEFSKENIIVIPFCSNVAEQRRLESEYSEELQRNSQAKKGFRTEKTLSQPALATLSAGFIGRPTQVRV